MVGCVKRSISFVAVVIIGLLFGAGTVSLLVDPSPDAALPDGHVHGPDTHTHSEDGNVTLGLEVEPPPTPPDYPDVEPMFEPLAGTNGEPIRDSTGVALSIDTAGLSAAEQNWLDGGGDPVADPAPVVDDSEWFEQPTGHPLDPRWYVGLEVDGPVISSSG